MDLDVEAYLRAVDRSVSSSMRDGAPARTVTLSRQYDTTLENLWDAATSPSRIPRWFMPVSGELELGGRYQLQGNAGGVVEACAPMARFAATWEFAGDVSWIEASFSDDAPGARLTLSHIALLSPHWDEYGPGAAGVGWDTGLLGLALHIDPPDKPKVDEEAFVRSPPGKAFIAGSSDAWAAAAIADGADPDAARAAARRTTAFYTGEPAPT